MVKTTRVERHLYRVQSPHADGRVHVYYIGRFTDWQGIPRAPYLAEDLPTARKLLAEALAHNVRCRMLGEPYDQREKDAKEVVSRARAAEIRARHRLTVAAWLPLCRQLPEMQ